MILEARFSLDITRKYWMATMNAFQERERKALIIAAPTRPIPPPPPLPIPVKAVKVVVVIVICLLLFCLMLLLLFFDSKHLEQSFIDDSLAVPLKPRSTWCTYFLEQQSPLAARELADGLPAAGGCRCCSGRSCCSPAAGLESAQD